MNLREIKERAEEMERMYPQYKMGKEVLALIETVVEERARGNFYRDCLMDVGPVADEVPWPGEMDKEFVDETRNDARRELGLEP